VIKPLPLPQTNTGKETGTTNENVIKPFPPTNDGKTENSVPQRPVIKPIPLPLPSGGKT